MLLRVLQCFWLANPGTPEEKSKLLFSMHDIKGDGFLSKDEFTSLLRSVLMSDPVFEP